MSKNKFLQIHALTVYGANNLNRDDLSRPKAMTFGGVPRLRISSQCIKRAYRLSDVMAQLCTGLRSKHAWADIGAEFVAQGHAEVDVVKALMPIVSAFEQGKGDKAAEADSADDAATTVEAAEATDGTDSAKPSTKSKGKSSKKAAALPTLDDLGTDALFFYGARELELIRALMKTALESKTVPVAAEVLKQVKALPMNEDVALFGRMVAGNKALSVEGALQVAHPMTVHRAAVEDDYFTAVDDLSTDVSGGAGHLGANGFGSGVYYHYFNLDLEVLLNNLGGDVARAKKLVEAFVEAVATVAPGGKQNSFAARSYASYLAVEVGQGQPFSYAEAFVRPVKGDNNVADAIQALKDTRESIFGAFPKQAPQLIELNRLERTGSLPDVQAFAVAALDA